MNKIKRKSLVSCLIVVMCAACCLMALPLTAYASSSDVCVYSTTYVGAVDDYSEHTVTIVADADEPFASYQMTLAAPRFIRITGVTACETTGEATNAVFSSDCRGNTVSVAYSSAYNTEGKVGLFQVTFCLDPGYYDIPTGTYDWDVRECLFCDEDAHQLTVSFELGSFTLTDQPARAKGDWDGDGAITLQDVMGMQRFIVSNTVVGTAQFNAGDVNCDGEINILDCQYVQMYLVGKIDSLEGIGGPEEPLNIYGITYIEDDPDAPVARTLTLQEPRAYVMTMGEESYSGTFLLDDEYICYLVSDYSYERVEVNPESATFMSEGGEDFDVVRYDGDGEPIYDYTEQEGEYTFILSYTNTSGSIENVFGSLSVTATGAFSLYMEEDDEVYPYVGHMDFDGTVAALYLYGWTEEDCVESLPVTMDFDESVVRMNAGSGPVVDPEEPSLYGTYTDKQGNALMLGQTATGADVYALRNGETEIEGYFQMSGQMALLVVVSDSANELLQAHLNIAAKTFALEYSVDYTVGDPVYAEQAGTYTDSEGNTIIVMPNGGFVRFECEDGELTKVYNGFVVLNDDGTGTANVFVIDGEPLMVIDFMYDVETYTITYEEYEIYDIYVTYYIDGEFVRTSQMTAGSTTTYEGAAAFAAEFFKEKTGLNADYTVVYPTGISADDYVAVSTEIEIYFISAQQEPDVYTIYMNCFIDGEFVETKTMTSPSTKTYGEAVAFGAEYYLNCSEEFLYDNYTVSYPSGIAAEDAVTMDSEVDVYFTSVPMTYTYTIRGNGLEAPAGLTYEEFVNYVAGTTMYAQCTITIGDSGSVYDTSIIEFTLEADNIVRSADYPLEVEGKFILFYNYEGNTLQITVTLTSGTDWQRIANIYNGNERIMQGSTQADAADLIDGQTATFYAAQYDYEGNLLSEQTATDTLSADNIISFPDDFNTVGYVVLMYNYQGETYRLFLYVDEQPLFSAVYLDYLQYGYDVFRFYEDGRLAVYSFDGVLVDSEWRGYTAVTEDGQVLYYHLPDLGVMILDGTYTYGEGEDAVTYPVLTDFRHVSGEPFNVYTMTYGPNQNVYYVYEDGTAEYYSTNQEGVEPSFVGTELIEKTDVEITIGQFTYMIDENNGLYIPTPETGLMCQTPFPCFEDKTSLAIYDNGMAYRVYRDGTVVGYFDWIYIDEEETVLCIDALAFNNFNGCYYKWAIDGQWHFVSCDYDIAEWDNTVYNTEDEDVTLTVYRDGERVIVINNATERATYGSIVNEQILYSYDYHGAVWYLLTGNDTAASAQWYPISYKYAIGGNEADVYEWTSEVFLTGEEEGYAAYLNLAPVYGDQHHLTTYTINEDGLYVLTKDGVELMYLFWNAEQERFYVYSADDLLYPVTVVYELDGETVEQETNATLWSSIYEALINTVLISEGTTDNLVITGIYTDSDRTEELAIDEVLNDTNGQVTLYVTVERYTAAEILQSAYEIQPGETLETAYILTGTIVSIDTEYNTNYHNMTFTMVVDGDVEHLVKCYRVSGCKYYVDAEGNHYVASLADLAVGDTVTVQGMITNYQGTVEFAQGCQVIVMPHADN